MQIYYKKEHYMIRAALGISHLKREILFITCTMWCIVIIVIWPLFRKMPVNQKPLNRIGIFWYQFTPRKLLYLMVSLNFIKFGPHWLSVFFFFFFWGAPCIATHMYEHFLKIFWNIYMGGLLKSVKSKHAPPPPPKKKKKKKKKKKRKKKKKKKKKKIKV